MKEPAEETKEAYPDKLEKKAGKKQQQGEGCPTVQCCGEGQCGHNELAAGFSHAEAIGQEHLPWSDGAGRPDWGDFERSRRRDMDDNRYNQL